MDFIFKENISGCCCMWTVNPTWVDRLNCLSVVSNITYFGLQDGKIFKISFQFDKFQNNSNEDITNIASDVEYPEQLF